MVDVMREHIEVIDGPGGPKARIAGHRIRVEDVVIWHEKLGMTAEEIVSQYPTISHADVYAALTYYWDHRDQIERDISEGRAFVDEFRRTHVGPLEEKLKRRRLG